MGSWSSVCAPPFCGSLATHLPLVCVCCIHSPRCARQPASRTSRPHTPTRRHSSSATPPPASASPRPRAPASISTATTAPGACSCSFFHSPPPLHHSFTSVTLLHVSTPLSLYSSWDYRNITSVPPSISLLKDLITLFVSFRPPFFFFSPPCFQNPFHTDLHTHAPATHSEVEGNSLTSLPTDAMNSLPSLLSLFVSSSIILSLSFSYSFTPREPPPLSTDTCATTS